MACRVTGPRARPTWRRALAPLLPLAALAALAGCDRLARGTAQGALEASVSRALPGIERQTGLEFKQKPRVELRTPAEVRAFLERAFNESRAARELTGQEQAYKLFGLVPEALDVRTILLDLLEEQVAGFYDPKTKTLYVVRGSVPPEALKLTIAHELVHALQDQYVSLDSIQNAEVDNDRATATQAAFEGHATYVSLLNVLGARALRDLPGGWSGVTENVRGAALAAEGLGAAPPAIREALIFPYTAGLTFVARAYPQRPGIALLTDPPRSTEQVLHPAAYDSAGRDTPTEITLPAPEGAKLVYENTLGEFETRLFLAQHLRDTAKAAQAATGWDGDRYQIVETPEGKGLVWVTVWDTPAAASRFHDALEAVTAKRFGARGGRSITESADSAYGSASGDTNPRPVRPASTRRAWIELAVPGNGRPGRSTVWYRETPATSTWSGEGLRGVTFR